MSDRTLVNVCPLLLTLVDTSRADIDLQLLNDSATEEITDRLDRLIGFARDLTLTQLKHLTDGTGTLFDEVRDCQYTPNRYRYFAAVCAAQAMFARIETFLRHVTAETMAYDVLGELGNLVGQMARSCVESRALDEDDLKRIIELFLSVELHIAKSPTRN